MTTPAWAPPLPNADVPRMKYREFTAEQVHAYAEVYRKAWVASLKPVAYMDPEWVKGKLWPDSCFMDPSDDGPPQDEDWVPLYRLEAQT